MNEKQFIRSNTEGDLACVIYCIAFLVYKIVYVHLVNIDRCQVWIMPKSACQRRFHHHFTVLQFSLRLE